MTTEQTLRIALESMTAANERQARQIEELTAQVKNLAAQLAWFQRQMFGRKSEKQLASEGQPSLFSDEELGIVKDNEDSLTEAEMLRKMAKATKPVACASPSREDARHGKACQ